MKKSDIISINATNYKLIEIIGNGGSGTVWKAHSSEEDYALKVIDSADGNKIERFKNEIDFCKKSNHKNIIKIIDDGTHKGKLLYVMPIYPLTLKNVIDGKKGADVLISYILKLCNALKYIHNKGHFHRDIKPENILVKGNGLVLADFGIAHFKDSVLTKKGNLLANRNYAAPEQKKKNNAENVAGAADIFSLGLIINECFTTQNPVGSDFKLIADSHPLYAELDNLVANMIRQNPKDRPSIDSVITEIKFVHKKIKDNLENIAVDIIEQTVFPEVKKSVLRSIIRTASEDIVFGKILFDRKSSDELNKYNHNWHMKIGYTVDDFLFNLYIQEQIHALCKSKFEYESNVYSKNNWYKSLDLGNNEKHRALYEQISEVLSVYKLQNHGESLFDLSGEILKYFSACADYHCKEILCRIKQEEESAKRNLKDAPIIRIVYTLKRGILKNIEYLLTGFNGLAGRYDFNFTDHISISTECIKTYQDNDNDIELLDSLYQKKETRIQEVLSEFQNKWKVIFNRVDERNYSVKFKTYSQFEKFRKFALDLSRPHYIFEGDVLNIMKNPSYIGNMVELKLDRIFEIPDTIAKIVGCKEIDE